jgi:hypothetical protein
VKLIVLPLKLLFLPFLLLALIVKLVVLLTVGAVAFAIFIPIAILVGFCALPFVLIAAVAS